MDWYLVHECVSVCMQTHTCVLSVSLFIVWEIELLLLKNL